MATIGRGHPESGDIEDVVAGVSDLGLESVNVPTSVAKALLLKHETCEAWREVLDVFEEELDIVLETILSAFEDFAKRKDVDESFRYFAVEWITRRCIQAFIYLSKGQVGDAESAISEAHRLTENCLSSEYISREYEDGLRYVLKSLKYSLDLAKSDGIWSAEKLAELDGHLQSYDKMSVKNRAVVLALKKYFIGTLSHEAQTKQLEVAKMMVELDPDNIEWHHCLHMVTRYVREAADKYGRVTQTEKDTILRAMELPGAFQDPRTLTAYISCLADIVRSESYGHGSIRLGTETFGSRSEAVTLIRSYADTILAIDPRSVRSNVNIAKIFSSVLPKDNRDEDFARVCLKRALIFRPDSSKVNHRLGVLYLSSGEPQTALEYVKKAYDSDKRNFVALMDCLKLFMADVKNNAKTLDEYFSSSLDRPDFRRISKNYASLILLKAVYEYLTANNDESMNDFHEAFIEHEGRTKEFILRLQKDCSRFGWEWNLHGRDLLGGLRNAFYQEFQAIQDPKRKPIFSALHEAAGGRRAGPIGASGCGRDFRQREGRRDYVESCDGFWRSTENGSSGHRNERGDGKKKNYSQPAGVNSDPHTILDVSRAATKDEINKAYHKMAMKYHPDNHRYVSPKEVLLKQEEMKLINKAWETLQD